MLKIFCFVFALALLLVVHSRAVRISIGDIPNPMISPELCGRNGVSKSVICDVHDKLSVDDKNVLEGVIEDINGIEFAIVVISETDSVNWFESKETTAKTYATTLHNEWGVGEKDLNNGVLLFVAIDDRTIFISVGDGLQEQLPDRLLDEVIEHMKIYFRQASYGKGLESGVVEIHKIYENKSYVNASNSEANVSAYLIYGVFAAVCVGMLYINYKENSRISNLTSGRKSLEKLIKDINKLQSDEYYAADSCPICLEEFDAPLEASHTEMSNSSINGIIDNNVGGVNEGKCRPMALKCGHVACFDCLKRYFTENPSNHAQCPICRKFVEEFGEDGTSENSENKELGPQPNSRSAPSLRNAYGASGGNNDNWRSNEDTNFSSSDAYGGGCSADFFPSPPHIHLSSMYRRREMLYRFHRMNYLYPDLLSPMMYGSMRNSLYYGRINEFQSAARVRQSEVNTIISDHQRRQQLAAKGSRGSSRSSFGGGKTSGGGRGGSW